MVYVCVLRHLVRNSDVEGIVTRLTSEISLPKIHPVLVHAIEPFYILRFTMHKYEAQRGPITLRSTTIATV